MRHMICGCVAALSLGAGAGAMNLVVNGGFETGDFTGWTVNAASGTTTVGAVTFPGQYAAFFGTFDAGWDSLEQSVTTTAGVEYTLRFYVLNYGVGDDGIAISLNGNEVYRAEPLFTPLEQWHQIEIGFLAQGAVTTFAISGGDNIASIGLDEVELYAVPAPGGVALGAMGMLLAARRRR